MPDADTTSGDATPDVSEVESPEVLDVDAVDAEPAASATVDWAPDDAALARYTDLARTALLDITPAETIGEPDGHLVEGDRVVSLYFSAALSGYPGWRWTVSLADVDGDPTVLETELTPGEGAVLAPEWTPWVDRLADYNTAQDAARDAEAAEAAADDASVSDDDDSDDDSDDDDDFDDDDSDDDSDDDDDESDDDESDDDESDDDESDDDDAEDEPEDEVGRVRSLLHAGDLDGVDIDDLDESAEDDDSDDLDESAEEDDPEDPDVPDADGSDADESDADEADDEAEAGELGDVEQDAAEISVAAAEPSHVDQAEHAEHDADSAGDEHPGAAGVDDRSGEGE